VLAGEVTARTALPEVTGCAVAFVAVAMVDVVTISLVECSPAARAVLTGALVLDALAVALS